MMYKFTWKDLGEVVAVEEVGFFAAMRLLKGEGLEDSDAALWLCDIDTKKLLKMKCSYGYELTIERV
jgi:hypothetical protein